jgi:hypothetical protein
MDDLKAKDVIDHQRWLINSGFANDMLNDNLYLFGIYLHPGIREALVSLDISNKLVTYRIYVTQDLFNDFNMYKKLMRKPNKSKFNIIRLKRLWRKHFENKKDPARLDIDLIIDSHVKELCGDNWSTSISILSESEYAEDLKTFQNEAEQNGPGPNREPDR